MEINNKININIHMFVFISIALTTIFTDIICFFYKAEYTMSLLISSIITLILIKCFYKKLFNIKSDFDKSDIIPIISIIFLSIFKLCNIDDLIDTITYHLPNQMNPFLDNINFDFLPSSVFFFPLGDRMNKIFSHFLGIRFGTLLSCYAVLIIYYQIKNALKILIPTLSTFKRTIFFLLFIFSVTIAIYPGTYFIDSYSSILTFELIYIFIRNINLLKNKKYLYFSAFITGCLIGIKISNILLAIPIILLLLIRNIKENGFKSIKNIKLYDYVLLIITAFLPFFVYLIRGFIQTGNPLFPLMNNIFHSYYLKDINGLDTRLGPKNIIEFIFWPIIICFNMTRGNDIYGLVENTWAIGYILVLYTIFNHKKHTLEINWFASLTIILTLIWTNFVLGYVRYGLALSYCNYIIIFYYLNNLKLKFEHTEKLIKNSIIYYTKIFISLTLFLLFIAINITYLCFYYNVIISSNTNQNTVSSSTISVPYDIEDGVWLCTRYNNFYTTIIKDKSDPMYNLDIITPIDPMCGWESKYSEYSQNIFKEKIKNKDLYIAIPASYDTYIYKLLQINNIDITELVGIYANETFLNPYNYVLVVKVKFI